MSNKAPELVRRLGGRRSKEDASKAADEYTQYFANADAGSRQAAYADVVNKYYDLATSFYEYGWGESFHFAHRYAWEPLNDSLKRHEHYLALRLQLQPSHKACTVTPACLFSFSLFVQTGNKKECALVTGCGGIRRCLTLVPVSVGRYVS